MWLWIYHFANLSPNLFPPKMFSILIVWKCFQSITNLYSSPAFNFHNARKTVKIWEITFIHIYTYWHMSGQKRLFENKLGLSCAKLRTSEGYLSPHFLVRNWGGLPFEKILRSSSIKVTWSTFTEKCWKMCWALWDYYRAI